MPEPKRSQPAKRKPAGQAYEAQAGAILDGIQVARQQGSTTGKPQAGEATGSTTEPALVTKLIDFIKSM